MLDAIHDQEAEIRALREENARLKAALEKIVMRTPSALPSNIGVFKAPGVTFTNPFVGMYAHKRREIYHLGQIARQALADQENRE